MDQLASNFWFIQAIGAVGIIFSIIAWNLKDRLAMLRYQAISTIIFIPHFYLLGAKAGAVMCVITLVRNFVFMQRDKKKWASHPEWLYVFIILSLFILKFFWEGQISILPVVGVIFGTYAISRNKPAEIRFYMLIACILWIPYAMVVHSHSGVAVNSISGIAILVGIYRLDGLKEYLLKIYLKYLSR